MAAEEEDVGSSLGVRSFWSGTITFGLVSVPVNLFPATVKRRVSFRMVAPEGSPIERHYVCSKDGKQLGPDDIVRGYEIDKGTYVTVEDEELEAIEPRKSREIDMRLFVDRKEIDPMYFDRGYFLTPAGGSNKAYRLLAEVMEKSGLAGIATFVMRAREYVVAIVAEHGVLRAETLRFQDEIRTPDDVGLPKKVKAKPADVKKFETLIAKHSGKLNVSEMLDDYALRVEDLVAKKQKHKEGVVRLEGEPAAAEEGGEVVDILEALRKSMGEAGAPRRRSAKKSPAKKRTAARKLPAAKKPKRA